MFFKDNVPPMPEIIQAFGSVIAVVNFSLEG
jgi:hypothetical protein